MATYRFSSLSDGQAIRFNPENDDLIFDQTVISAADLRITTEGAHLRVRVVAGAFNGKDILLLNVAPQQLATSNVSFANGSQLLFGDNTTLIADEGPDFLIGTAGRDHLRGFGGEDSLDGGAGADYLDGGLGDDRYFVTAGDLLADSGGIDTVESGVTWILANGFENLLLTGTANINGTGNSGNNIIAGNSGNNAISGRDGDDFLTGGAGNDTFIMSNGAGASYGNDQIDGGEGVDTLDYGTNARSAVTIDLGLGTASGGGTGGTGTVSFVDLENANGGGFNDSMTGSAEANFLFGFNGNDSIDGAGGNDRLDGAAGNDALAGSEGDDLVMGGAGDDALTGGFAFASAGNATGNDTLVGGAGRDFFVFNDNPNPFISSPAATADRIGDFASRTDTLVFDDNVFPTIGAPGRFAEGDARFYSARGATAGHDETDRVIYDTSTGSLYYDPDGNGELASQIIATLNGAPAVVASDIAVI
jgi:Ca2+-binding RTX toxin-like protein